LNRRYAARNWRQRGRRGQVSAVATLLGLLLVVTFIANYLSTQLPSQMAVNDLNHEVLLENQLGRFGALLQTVATNFLSAAQVTQPISLGTAAAPPFAPPDTSFTSGVLNQTSTQVNYSTTNLVATTPLPLGGGFVVHLQNTYAPQAQLAYSQGAVVFAQIGGTPVFIDNPQVSATTTGGSVTALRIWMPEFSNRLPSVAGAGTTILTSRLLSVNVVVVSPTTHLTFAPGSSLVFTVTSQYAAAWVGFYHSQNWPGVTVTCSPAASTVCTGPFSGSSALGRVVLTVPTANLAYFSLSVGLFSLTVQ
jgi:hypothetical protein